MTSHMKAAIIETYGKPSFGFFNVPDDVQGDNVMVRPIAAAISGIDRAIASGKHFLSPKTLPVVAGRDGVAWTDDGRLVYFDGTVAPWGSMAEQTLTSASGLIEIPSTSDPMLAAALGNAGMAAWLPLSWRAALQPGETVVVLGAGGFVGLLAVQAARLLGAGQVIAVVRGTEQAAQALEMGADATVDTSSGEDTTHALKAACPDGANVIVDYLWGDVATAAIENAAVGARFVQIGTVAGDTLALSGEAMRSRSIDLLGYVSFRAPFELRAAAYRTMVEWATAGTFRLKVEQYPLSEVDRAWSARSSRTPTRPVVEINS